MGQQVMTHYQGGDRHQSHQQAYLTAGDILFRPGNKHKGQDVTRDSQHRHVGQGAGINGQRQSAQPEHTPHDQRAQGKPGPDQRHGMEIVQGNGNQPEGEAPENDQIKQQRPVAEGWRHHHLPAP